MSSSVFLNNLDDFIAPSQACVNPLVASKLHQPAIASSTGQDGLQLSTSSSGKRRTAQRITLATDFSAVDLDDSLTVPYPYQQPDLIKGRPSSSQESSQRVTVAQVSLNDCLACSGCVTSAETMLITEQSTQKLVDLLDRARHRSESTPVIVVQVSPNSIASLAEFLDSSPRDLFLRLAAILKQHGVTYVLNAAVGADIALLEMREEFFHRLEKGRSQDWTVPAASMALSSSSIAFYPTKPGDSLPIQEANVGRAPELGSNLPMLTSHCPGWVCYAEKTSPQAIPYMSTVKSPQQIIGSVFKRILSSNSVEHSYSQLQGQQVFVVSVQPCFDKKLEASRKVRSRLSLFHHTNYLSLNNSFSLLS